MYVLGINAAFHDSAACILKDGKLLAATEEERFTHFKHHISLLKWVTCTNTTSGSFITCRVSVGCPRGGSCSK